MSNNYPTVMAKPEMLKSLERTQELARELSTLPLITIRNSGILEASEMLHRNMVNMDIRPAVEAISSAMRGYYNMVNNMEPIISTLAEFNSRMSTIFTNQNLKMLQETVSQMGRISSMYTEAFQSTIRPVIESIMELDGIPIDDLTKEEVHEKLVESADEQYKEAGTTTPYNVLSMEHIFTVVLPGLGVLDALKDIGSMSPEVAFNFFLFSIVPMIYTLVSIMKSKEPVKIVFDEEDEE